LYDSLYENASPFGDACRGIRVHRSSKSRGGESAARKAADSALTWGPKRSGMHSPSPLPPRNLARQAKSHNWHCESRAAPPIHNAETRRRKVNEIVPLREKESDLSRERERARNFPSPLPPFAPFICKGAHRRKSLPRERATASELGHSGAKQGANHSPSFPPPSLAT